MLLVFIIKLRTDLILYCLAALLGMIKINNDNVTKHSHNSPVSPAGRNTSVTVDIKHMRLNP